MRAASLIQVNAGDIPAVNREYVRSLTGTIQIVREIRRGLRLPMPASAVGFRSIQLRDSRLLRVAPRSDCRATARSRRLGRPSARRARALRQRVLAQFGRRCPPICVADRASLSRRRAPSPPCQRRLGGQHPGRDHAPRARTRSAATTSPTHRSSTARSCSSAARPHHPDRRGQADSRPPPRPRDGQARRQVGQQPASANATPNPKPAPSTIISRRLQSPRLHRRTGESRGRRARGGAGGRRNAEVGGHVVRVLG